MPTTELALSAERVSGISEKEAQGPEREIYPALRSLHGDRGSEVQGSFAPSDSVSASLQAEPRPFRLIAKGEETVQVDTWLQATSVEADSSLRLIMETPEEVRGLKIRMSVDFGAQKFNLSYSVEMPGLPLDEALYYTRFLKVLYSEGTLSLIILDPVEATIADVPLPVPLEGIDQETLVWHMSFYDRLREVGEAMGIEMVCPYDIEDEDLDTLDYIESIISSGWVVDRVTGFKLWLPEEGALDLLNHDRTLFEGLIATTDDEHISLFGADISLGPTMRWIGEAQLETPLEEVKKWLQSHPEEGQVIETKWSTPQNSALHRIFYDWPKPSLDRIQEDIAAFERKYGIGWRRFKRDWEKNRTQHIDDAALWASLIEARDYLRQKSS